MTNNNLTNLNYEPHLIPRIAIQCIAAGLIIMAFFTMMWSGIAASGLKGSDNYFTTIIFSAFSLTFIVYGILFFRIARRFPKLTTDSEKVKAKDIQIN